MQKTGVLRVSGSPGQQRPRHTCELGRKTHARFPAQTHWTRTSGVGPACVLSHLLRRLACTPGGGLLLQMGNEGFPEEMSFELQKKTRQGGKMKGGRSLSDRKNGLCKRPIARAESF